MAESCLIVIDVQNDFMPGGALAVPQGDEVVGPINRLIEKFDHVVLTQDWHPAGHMSFASQHPGRNPMETIEAPYGPQILWPDHCVQGSLGADFHPDLEITKAELILRKGFRREIDSYSAFFENDHRTPTGLGGYLKDRHIQEITLCGLATDFCVGYSALDAARLGFKVDVELTACRGIDVENSVQDMLNRLRGVGVGCC